MPHLNVWLIATIVANRSIRGHLIAARQPPNRRWYSRRLRRGSELDDGLHTAGEISQLKLDADWVVLSVCNTAAPDGTPGAEGLSGLARAFFYAGARSLLVSHWVLSSEAAVAITTRMFDESTKGASKAEALRQSMLALMARTDKPYYAHPALWAPFVPVGEGNTGWEK
jgi:CHAT domain-containing protein